MMKKCKQGWIQEGKKNNKPYVFFDNYCLDLSKFLRFHPGGQLVMKKYYYQDVTEILFQIFPHNRVRTPQILQQYRIGKIEQNRNETSQQHRNILKTILKTHNRKQTRNNTYQKKQVQFPTEVKFLASQKQRLNQLELVKKKSKQKSKQKKISLNRMNPDYVNALKGKNLVNNDKFSSNIAIPKHTQKAVNNQNIQPNVHFQCSIGENLKQPSQKCQNEQKLNKQLKSSIGSMQINQQIKPNIKIPVMVVKMDRIW